MNIENSDYKAYRKNLAEEIKKEPSQRKQKEILDRAQETQEYLDAKILHHADAIKEKQHLVEGGFIKESGVFEKVVEFAKAVESAGGKAFLVGGSVRDEVMGLSPKDYDIEVFGIEPEDLRRLAESFGKVNEVGTTFGILKIRIDNIDVDISLPRRESKTGVGHRDFAVNADPNMSVKEAVQRRDFTFNSLAKNILSGEIYDFVGGIDDIEHRIIRVTNEKRFKDDPLRVLRGIQFAGRFGFKVDDKTVGIMREMLGELKFLPKERLKEEWIKLFLRSKKPSLGLQTAMELGIFYEMHSEIVKLSGISQGQQENDVWAHTLVIVDEAAKIIEQEQLKGEEALVVMLASFCHDFEKSITPQESESKIKSPWHKEVGAVLTIKFLSEIGIEAKLQDQIAKLIAERLKLSQLYAQEVQHGEKVTNGTIKRLASRISPATIKQLICVAKADYFGHESFVDSNESEKSFTPSDYPAGKWLLERATELGIYETRPKPVLLGKDLIALGFKPGPLFGEIIKSADEMHIKGFSREEILSLITSHTDTSLEKLAQILVTQEK